MKLPPVGLQLIVFGKRYSIERDTDAILDAVAKAGYKGVEGAARDVATYRRKLQERNLVCGGYHVNLKALEDVRSLAKRLHELGCHDVCNSGLAAWEKRSLEDYREAIAALNRAGRTLRGEGIRLHYHNHDFEFQKVDGPKTGMDLLIDGLDPDAADLCVDVAWVMRAGADPVSFLREHKDRIGYIHLKDHDGTDWTELGRGKLDLAGIMKVLPELTGVRWVMVEQDSTKLDPMESIAISRAYLKEKFGY